MIAKKQSQAKKSAKKPAIAKGKAKASGKANTLRVIDRRSPNERRKVEGGRKGGRRKGEITKSKAPQLRVELLEKTFAALAPKGEELVSRFYGELFTRYPGVRKLFANADQADQQRKLLSALSGNS